MSGSEDTAIANASDLESVHNIHSLAHSLYLRNGWLGILFLVSVVAGCLWNAFRAIAREHLPPLLAFCILYPIATIITSLPAANAFLTEFALLAMMAQAGIFLRNPYVAEAHEVVRRPEQVGAN